MITIVAINESTAASDAAVQAMLAALAKQLNLHLGPAWDVEPVSISFIAKGMTPIGGAWQLVFLDDSDQADALAYHDVTTDGLPICKIFVKSILADNASLSVAASHELCEAMVDPTINLAAQDLNGTFWAYEVCDPVEDEQYGYLIDGVLVSDFALPSWFGYKDSAAPFDYLNKTTAPFQVLTAGYAQQFDPSKGWVQINGSKLRSNHALVAQRGSRREQRARRK